MTLSQFLLVSQMQSQLSHRCDAGLRGGPWLSRTSRNVYVLLPTGRIVTTESWVAALYAQEAAWEGVEIGQDVLDWCDGIRPVAPPTPPLPAHPVNPIVWSDFPPIAPE